MKWYVSHARPSEKRDRAVASQVSGQCHRYQEYESCPIATMPLDDNQPCTGANPQRDADDEQQCAN